MKLTHKGPVFSVGHFSNLKAPDHKDTYIEGNAADVLSRKTLLQSAQVVAMIVWITRDHVDLGCGNGAWKVMIEK